MKRRDFVRTLTVAGVAYPLVGCGAGVRVADAPAGGATPAGAATRSAGPRLRRRLDAGWRFLREDVRAGESPGLDDAAWQRATLPHTARVEALVTGEPGSATDQWQGVCWYRRRLRFGTEIAGRRVLLKFEAAMNVADVFLDGQPLGRHLGGYLPFVFDVTDRVAPGREALLAVRLDNTDNPITGPKPLEILDFNMYGGLYRYVHVIVEDPLHITDPILADRVASGGVFVTYPEVSAERAVVRVQTHVRNDHPIARTFRLRIRLTESDRGTVSEAMSDPVTLESGAETEIVELLEVAKPRLWSPAEPNLYDVHAELVSDGVVVDAEATRVGIRRIHIDRDGFRINGERMFLRGTNRHQEYPYVGYALSAAAHYRDARRIKDAGFDYVRLSHYPHAPAFMDACDELGLVVMNAIPGWQYFGKDPAFAELQYRNCRELVRRDRNHPCVILWEVSLNESPMTEEFIARAHAITHEEYPGDQCYTCGWMRGYDVFIRARQHGGCHGVEEVPCLVSEYGDWEYYAMTAGLNQEDFQALSSDESNSRQLRWHGERAMLQQATNFQEAHDDNRSGVAFGDGLWVMFDYNRGYAPDIESSGCMDLFRLPKYSYWFFRSQRPPHERLENADSGPMVRIASEWTADSPAEVRVFSNCDEVELRLNGAVIERRRPDRDRISSHLPHPPFSFRVEPFRPGRLEAIGYVDGREAARHVVRTPGPIAGLHLSVAEAGRAPTAGAKDVLIAHAALRDGHDTVVPHAWENVAFGATGDALLVGANPFSTEAGIASILLQTEPRARAAAVYALSVLRDQPDTLRVLHDATTLFGGAAPEPVVRYTTDGSVPGAHSPRYTGPVAGAEPVHAALLVDGVVVASLDERTGKFRPRGSAAPERRQPYGRR